MSSERINLLVMPTDICNMNCLYCFHESYHEKEGKMSLATLQKLYEITFKHYSEVAIIWHGGEPLVMGLDFYKKALEMQKQFCGVKVRNSIQSNLTLLTDKFADFLCENDFGVSTSFDGCKNDETRGNSEEILKGREKIIARKKNCGVIMVLSKINIDSLIESYECFKSKNINFTINPYSSIPSPADERLKLDADYTVKKILELFEYWLHDTSCKIRISYFERFLDFVVYQKKDLCVYNSCLGKWMGIRYDGTIMPCNRWLPAEYSYGNVWDYEDLSQAFESSGFKKLISEAIERRYKCQSCVAFPLCSGGCNNAAFNENGIANNGGKTCIMMKAIYQHIIEVFKNIQAASPENDFNYNPRVISEIRNSKQ